MRILIDGYNLLHASTVTPPASSQGTLADTRNALLDFLLDRLPPGMAPETVVVFDKGTERGLPAEISYGQLKVMFAVNHPEADDLIEELIQASTIPRRLTVVSSDHRIQRAAKRRKAQPVDSEVWLAALQRRANAAGQTPAGPIPVEGDWLAEFQDVDVDAIQRAVEDEFGNHAAPESPRNESSDSVRDALLDAGRIEHRSDDDAENPFPEGYGEDVLPEKLEESPFPEGYGEDLLEDE